MPLQYVRHVWAQNAYKDNKVVLQRMGRIMYDRTCLQGDEIVRQTIQQIFTLFAKYPTVAPFLDYMQTNWIYYRNVDHMCKKHFVCWSRPKRYNRKLSWQLERYLKILKIQPYRPPSTLGDVELNWQHFRALLVLHIVERHPFIANKKVEDIVSNSLLLARNNVFIKTAPSI